jgi:hypothetical protein
MKWKENIQSHRPVLTLLQFDIVTEETNSIVMKPFDINSKLEKKVNSVPTWEVKKREEFMSMGSVGRSNKEIAYDKKIVEVNED